MRALRLGAVALAAGLALVSGGCSGAGEPRPDLLLVSTRDGDYAIYELDADGGSQRRLTDSDVDPEDLQKVYFQIDPAWAPDASRIAFSSRRGSSFDIYSMLADGSDTQQLTSTKENEGHPTWSPDGQSIAFARSGPGRIYVMSADGSGARRLTKDPAEEADPAWSPDGNWIAYTRRTPGSAIRELWLVRPDGTEPHAVTNFERAVYGPAWSPDSQRIAFAADLDRTTYDIYSVDLEGGSRRRYTHDPLRFVRACLVTRRADDCLRPRRCDRADSRGRQHREAHGPGGQRLVPGLEPPACSGGRGLTPGGGMCP